MLDCLPKLARLLTKYRIFRASNSYVNCAISIYIFTETERIFLQSPQSVVHETLPLALFLRWCSLHPCRTTEVNRKSCSGIKASNILFGAADRGPRDIVFSISYVYAHGVWWWIEASDFNAGIERTGRSPEAGLKLSGMRPRTKIETRIHVFLEKRF